MMMKKLAPRLLVALLCLLLPLSAHAAVFADSWLDATLDELYEAQTKLEARIEELEAEKLAAESALPGWKQGSADIVVYEDAYARITWKGLNDTHTSGMDFQPTLLMENLSDTETVKIDPDEFYVNGFKMSASNSGAVTLKPGTSLMLNTQYSWLLSAEDLVRLYGCDRITRFEMFFTVQDGSNKKLAEDQAIRMETNIDIFTMMGGNSTFNRKYPNKSAITPLEISAMPVVYEDDSMLVAWHGFADTHTSGMDFQPDVLIMNKTSDRELTLDPEAFYVNHHKMSASNSGSITLRPGASIMLSTQYSWLLSAGDLLDCYGETYISDFRLIYSIYDEDRRYLTEDSIFHIQPDVNLFDLMSGNSTFNRKYPDKTAIRPLDTASMPVVFDNDDMVVFWNGFSDTHTSGMDFQPNVFIQNKSATRTLSFSPDSVYINGILMSMSNSGAITLEPQCSLMLNTQYSWLLSSGDLLDHYGETAIHDFRMIYSIRDDNRKYIAEKQVFQLKPEIDLFELMSGNSTFTRNYPDKSAIQPLDSASMTVLFENEDFFIAWNGLADTHTSGMDFQPVLFLQNKSATRSLTLDPDTIYVNDHKMSVSNFSSLTLEPGCKLNLATRYSWLISSEDLIDAYNEDTIRSFELTYSIYDENRKAIVSNKLFTIDLDISLYDLMGGNSTFNRKHPKE